MTRREFINIVIEIYFRDNCMTVRQAIDIAEKELKITKEQFQEWFGNGCKRGENKS